MNKQVDELVEWVAKILWRREAGYTWTEDIVDSYEAKLAKESYGKLARQILSHPDLALIDRDAKLPKVYNEKVYTETQKQTARAFVRAGWKPVTPLSETLKEAGDGSL